MAVRLRTTLEVPDVYDTDAYGNPIYPREDDGTTGGAFTYNAQHMGDPPPPRPRFRVFDPDNDNDDLLKAAAASAIILKAAADKQHRRLNRAADAERERLGEAANLTHEQQAQDARAAQERLKAVEPMPQDMQETLRNSIHGHRQDTPSAAATPLAPRDTVAAAPHGFTRTLAYEDSTNWPLYGQMEYGGHPPIAPTGNVLTDASGPMPQGLESGVHGPAEAGSGEASHEDVAQRAYFARLQARGVAEMAEDRRGEALAKIDELRRKGLPTEAAEREAGWAFQQELRARGMEEENRRIMDAQIWREREDIGAAQAQAAREEAAAREENLRKTAEEARKEQEEIKPLETVAVIDLTTPDNTPQPQAAPQEAQAERAASASAPAAAAAAAANLPDVETVREGGRTVFVMRTPPQAQDIGYPAVVVVASGDGGAAAANASYVQSDIDAAVSAHAVAVTRDNPTIATDHTLQTANGMQGPPMFLPADAPFIVGRPTLNEGDLAYQLAWIGDDTYLEAQQELAREQDEIRTDEPEDPMRGIAAMRDANAPFRRDKGADDHIEELQEDTVRQTREAEARAVENGLKAPPGPESEPDAPKLEPK